MKSIWFCMLLLVCASSTYAKKLALSFDDGLDPTVDPQAKIINDEILKQLRQHHIRAIIFPAINKIDGKNGLPLVEQWGKQGHRIGNHSESHLNLNKDEVTLPEYIDSLHHGHLFFKDLHGFVQRYRYPFLKEGNTIEKRDAVRQWLSQHHYQSGAVSIDASDWYYNQLFLKFKQQQDISSLNKLKQAYITHLIYRAEYYDSLAEQTLHRSPSHVLLLHVRAINAAWLDDIIQAFQQAGWQFVDSDMAYQDTLYSIQLNTLPAGESILWSIAKVYGIDGLRYPAEDAPYEKENLQKYGLKIDE